VVRVQHAAIQWLRKTPVPLAQTARWLLFIEQYDFEVQHRKGKKHGNADALSRRPHVCKQCKKIVPAEVRGDEDELIDDPEEGVETCPRVRVVTQTEASTFPEMQTVCSMEELAELQAQDPELAPIVQLRLQQSDQPTFDTVRAESAETKFCWSQWFRLVVRDGVVFRVIFDRHGRPCGQQLLAPKFLRNELIEMVRVGLTSCHVGVGKTIFQVGRRAWWKRWKADVRRFYQRCSRCSRYFRGKLPRQGALQPPRVGSVMKRISIDLTGPHTRSKRGNVYICTVIDVFSKWLEVFPIRNKEALPESVRDRMRESYDIARENLQVAANRNKRYYDMLVKQRSFVVGDSVYYYNSRRFQGRSDKWSRKYTGPFVVEKVLLPVTYLLRRSPRCRPFVTHVDKLRRCLEAEPEVAPPTAAGDPVVPPNPPSPGRENAPTTVVYSQEPCSSDEEREARPKRSARAPQRLIEQC